jgi:GT2 family glycosyltransferase/polysaccharide pyruvyl transferase WcaK-like protein
VALGGGGLFQDYNRLETAGLFESPKMGVHSYINVPLIAHIYRKPVAYLFQGVGPLFSEDSRNFTKYAYSMSSYISVRDRDSVRLLEEMGIRDVVLSSDPTFLYPVKNVKTEKERPKVGISLRQWVDQSVEEKITGSFTDFLNIAPEDYDFYFISFQDHDDQNTDSSIYQRIKSNLKRERNFSLIRSKDYSLEGIERIIADLDFLIGMRLHSIILAMKYGIPFFAIPYWNKVDNLLSETGLDDLSTSIKEISGEKIRDQFLSIIPESSDIKKRIKNGMAVINQRLQSDIDTMKDFFTNISGRKLIPLPVEKPDEKAPLPVDWLNYKAYQERLKRQFYKNRYSRFQIDRILNRRNYKKIIFYPSPILWDVPLFQRPHQIFKELSKRGYLIFFLSPDPKADRAEPIREINENLYLIKDIDMLYCLKDEPIVLWITWTPNIVCKELFPNSIVVYDWIDELDIFGYYSKFMEIDHKKLLRSADIVLATSDSLLEEAKTLRSDALLVPNGVNIEDFKVEGDLVPEDMANILANGKPVIGFYGLLGDWRVDYDLVNYLCSECRDLNFVFIGPCYDGSAKKLKAADNLFLLGPKKYEELKYYLKHFDVAIIPYKVDRITNSVFPVKLCEYMAGGKPIATTNMTECRKFKSVLVSENGENFIKNIRKALLLKNDMDYFKVLTEEAYSNRWEDRVDKVINALESERLLEPAGKEQIEERLSMAIEEIEAMQKLLDQSIYEIDVLNSKLTQTIVEREGLSSQLNQTLAKKEEKIRDLLAKYEEQEKHYTQEVTKREEQVYELIGNLNHTKGELNGIYTSHFWKVASSYYKVRDNIPIIRTVFKAIKILRREGVKSLVQRLRKKAKYNFSQEPLGLAKEIKYGKETKGAAPVPEADVVSCPNRYDVIFFSIINWDFRFQRPQQIASRFAKNGHRVFYLSVDLKKQTSYTERPIAENVYEITLPFKENTPIYNANLKEALEITTYALEDLFKDFRIKESIAFVEFPLWYPLVEWLRGQYGAKVIFDCLDEFSGFGNVKADIERIEEMLLKSSDFCITTSVRLHEKLKNKCKNIAVVRNATEFEHFHRLPENDVLKDIKRPIIGYYGAIAEWFDTDTVEHIAIQKPDWNIVLIGHTFGSDIGRLKKYKNIYLLGEKPYAELPKYLYWFDVCIIPFKINELTLSTNPVKFYEFISSGKPVVSSKLPELLPYAEFLYLSEGKEEFLKNIEVALKENDEDLISRRVELARENDWESRFNEVQNYIQSTYPMVSIIIVTFNNLDYTKLCIESIYEKTAYPNFEVIVVDNASTDGTRDYLLELKDGHSNVKVILNEENLSFARANNMGIKASDGEYIILLNNDTVVTGGWISGLIKYFKDPSVGMAGPVTNSIGNEAKIDVDYRDLSEMDRFAEKYTTKHRGVSFGISVLALYCAVLSRKAIDRVGLLDEQFLIGMFEDDDYALRLKKEGFKQICIEDVFIHHFGGATLSRLQPNEYQRIFEENKRRYEQKWGIDWQPHKYRDGVI